MSVSILKTPTGHTLNLNVVGSAVVVQDGIDALFYDYLHSLVEGSYVYIFKGPKEYLGFWYVDRIDSVSFKLKEYATGTPLPFYTDGIVVEFYFSNSVSAWVAVEQPIVYKLSNNKYPTNSVETSRTVSSFADEVSVELTLSGAIKSGLQVLDTIRIEGATDDRVNGVYKVLSVTSDSVFVIDLPYDAGYSFSGAVVSFMYNNYHIVVRVYAGLPNTHKWRSLKPSTLITELRFIPEQDNAVEFSINNIIKSTLSTINNVLSISMPNDVAMWSEFYIEVAEAYDFSDGSEVTTFISSFTAESTREYAVNASMPFKDMFVGNMAAYATPDATRKFLTNLGTLVLFGGCADDDDCYQDISVILDRDDLLYTLRKTFYKNNVEQQTVDVPIQQYDKGLYRVQVNNNVSCEFDKMTVKIIATTILIPSLSQWYNVAALGSNWTLGSTPTRTFTGFQIDHIGFDMPFFANTTYVFKVRLSHDLNIQATVSFYRANNTVLSQSGVVTLSGTNMDATLTLSIGNVTTLPAYAVLAVNSLSSSTNNVALLSAQLVSINPPAALSEIKTYAIDCSCTKYDIKLTWLNNLGGWEYWKFTAGKDYQVDIANVATVRNNLLTDWPNSYGEFADTIDKDVNRISRNQIIVRSQNLTRQQVTELASIKTSALVQIINSKYDRRTVHVDSQSFRVYTETDKLFTVSFTITYTDDLPIQSV